MTMSLPSDDGGADGGAAVVTGAAQGIGRAIASRLAADGYRVVCVDLDPEAVAAVAEEVGGEGIALDVTDDAGVAGLGQRVPDCGLLVNNAAIQVYRDLLATTPEEIRRVLDVNVVAPVLLAQSLVPVMAARGGGSIINLSSITGRSHAAGVSLYPTSKAAIDHLTAAMALEFGPLGIRCNAVAPGTVETEGTAAHYGSDAARASIAGVLPLGRMGRPEDIAAAVAWLASPEASWITGQVLAVDGGFLAAPGHFFRLARKAPRTDASK